MGDVLVLGNHRQTVAVVRSLARAGHRVVVGRGGRRGSAELSRFVSERWDCGSEEGLVASVEAWSRGRDARTAWVFPVGESSLRALAPAEARLDGRATLVAPDPRTVQLCLDKPSVYALAARMKVPLPPTSGWEDRARWLDLAEDFGWPCVVKPSDSSHTVKGAKARILSGPAELAECLRGLEAEEEEGFVLQKWMPGRRRNCQFAAVDGDIVAWFEQEVLRTDVLDGTGYGVEMVAAAPLPIAREEAGRLLARLGYTGVGCVQFLASSRGEISLLEINPRLDATCAHAVACGVDFPRLALDCARWRRERIPPPPPARPVEYPVGARAAWTLGDIQGCLKALRREGLGPRRALAWLARTALAFLRASRHLTFRWDDPLPALHAWSAALAPSPARLGQALRAIFHRRPATARHGAPEPVLEKAGHPAATTAILDGAAVWSEASPAGEKAAGGIQQPQA